ncbi:Ribonuclease, Rne/Rng family [Roseibacterium elongatum DSM 19469]|uniref:Ribonuclease, Rne/Rng family n=1 Tax=Roseicyclus elongatus DSM 19469 TaxID=1294273 RepID=W8S6A7_9RHOB|nr:ribonuclease E/G [Roseibacterium elongatum]AHM05787.1 Ribonuclease, Rne/Rng family [Roseibacterium elongatum DSM 19469]
MKGRVVLLDQVAGRRAAALMVDGHLADLLIDPPETAGPQPGAIYRAVADRPMKGQGGLTLTLGDGEKGYLRAAKGLAPGTTLLVQVAGVAEPDKAAPVTLKPLFKSRFAIITPDAPGLNISRRIKDEAERDRLLEIAHATMQGAPDGHGLILRSAAGDQPEEVLAEDIAAMRDLAAAVMADAVGRAELLVDAPDAHLLAWRDWAEPTPDEVEDRPGCFEASGALDAIEEALSTRLRLTGDAFAFIEPTRALVAVDVNTGGDTSLSAGLKANLALARSLPGALRIKGLGGQVVLDLAPMPKKERRVFEDALRRAFRQDGAEAVLAGWTPLGHYEVQRKRDRFPLAQVWPGAHS